MDTKRLFIGFRLNADWNDAISQFIENQHSVRIKWIPEINWHFTILFIGDFPVSHLEEFKAYLKTFYVSVKRFGIPFDTFVYAPNPKRPRMIWCKGAANQNFIKVCEETARIVKEFCENKTIAFAPDERAEIIPHVTLARFPYIFHPPALRIVDVHAFPLPIQLSQAHLYESELTSSGAVYTILQTFKLGK